VRRNNRASRRSIRHDPPIRPSKALGLPLKAVRGRSRQRTFRRAAECQGPARWRPCSDGYLQFRRGKSSRGMERPIGGTIRARGDGKGQLSKAGIAIAAATFLASLARDAACSQEQGSCAMANHQRLVFDIRDDGPRLPKQRIFPGNSRPIPPMSGSSGPPACSASNPRRSPAHYVAVVFGPPSTARTSRQGLCRTTLSFLRSASAPPGARTARAII